MLGLASGLLRLPMVVLFFVILAVGLVVVVRGPADAERPPEPPGATVSQEPETTEEVAPPQTVFQPITGGWSLLANTGPATSPGQLLRPIRDLAPVVFAFDAAGKRFRTFHAAHPNLSDLTLITEGEAVWIFVPPERLGGDVAFLELPRSAHNLPATLESGFTLVSWTGADGRRASLATEGLPVRRVLGWDGAAQRYRVWDTRVPEEVQDDFPLEYGAGLWIDLRGSESVVWFQR